MKPIILYADQKNKNENCMTYPGMVVYAQSSIV